MPEKFTNRLIHETSPYLLQHAHNPVNWQPWGDIAFQQAIAQNKPILVSIGYAACHWCHVMERESFEDEATAEIMNEHFINIKIDREERPDIDHIYMDALQAMTGSGGWPLNIFLTPDKKPFYGGTYFPPVNRYNRASWKEVLLGIAKAWKDRKHEIESQAENLLLHLDKSNRIQSVDLSEEMVFTRENSELIAKNLLKTADTEWGGFGRAPKFPQTFSINNLLLFYHLYKDENALKQALLSINKMLDGGIYDQIGGGLARYSTDNEWLAPHFEKMLYDNALFISTLCDAFQITKDTRYEKAIRKTIKFIKEEWLSNEKVFYAAYDADSDGEEGKYYVWQKNEIELLLGKDADLFCRFFDVTEKGNWQETPQSHRTNILRILTPPDVFAQNHPLNPEEFELFIEVCLNKLAKKREERNKPLLDDKIILSWNALMIKALAKAAVVLNDNEYQQIAVDAFNAITRLFQVNTTDVAKYHVYKQGNAKFPAFLEDYAFYIDAALQLYELTLNDHYIEIAKANCTYTIHHFSDENDSFFYFTPQEQKDVVLRKIEMYDGATPSGNAVMAENMLRLSVIIGNNDWYKRSIGMIIAASGKSIGFPGSFGVWSKLILLQTVGINEIAVIGKDFFSISREILLFYIPNKILMGCLKENDLYPLLSDKPEVSKTLIYLCKNFTCLAPLDNKDKLIEMIC